MKLLRALGWVAGLALAGTPALASTYFLAVKTPALEILVDPASIENSSGGQRTAALYAVDDTHRIAFSRAAFDCDGKQRHTLWAKLYDANFSFINESDSTPWVPVAGNTPDGRVFEFVCGWPAPGSAEKIEADDVTLFLKSRAVAIGTSTK